MAELGRLVASEVLLSYEFGGMQRVVDVGGGYGALLAAILTAHPGVRGVLFDLHKPSRAPELTSATRAGRPL